VARCRPDVPSDGCSNSVQGAPDVHGLSGTLNFGGEQVQKDFAKSHRPGVGMVLAHAQWSDCAPRTHGGASI
jgi:hypothetical protein